MIRKYSRDAVATEMSEFCALADKNDMLEVTHWANGEGFDVSVLSVDGERNFSMSWGELRAINKCVDFDNYG